MALKYKLERGYHKRSSTLNQLVAFLLLFLCQIFQVHAETWPWLAFIPSLNCTGAIVHESWMLTTSNCFLNKSIPSELFVEIQGSNSGSEGKGAKLVYVNDYTRHGSAHGLAMLYLAKTVPSLTQNVVALRAKNVNMAKTGIVLSWDLGRATGARNVNAFALAVDIVPCVGDSTRHVCVSLDKHLASTSSILQFCSGATLGSSLVIIDENGLVCLAGLLHERTGCQLRGNFIGRFIRIDYGRKWIRQQFRIQDYPQCKPSMHRTLEDPSRDLRKSHERISNLCDTELPRAWYRFKLDGHSAELPTVCPAASACGRTSAIWLPKADRVELGKQVKIKACASWVIGSRRICCFWQLSVFVRHCGDFKVYYLRRTDFCPTAYCAEVAKGVCGPGQTGYKPNCKDSYPKLPKVLQFYPFYAYQGSPRRPYVYLRCLFNRKKRDSTVKYVFHLYTIKQGRDGKVVKNLVHRKETTRSYFDVRLLPERYPVGLGDTVVCEVQSFFQTTKSSRSPVLASKNYHLGIQVQPSSTFILAYPNVINVTFTITLPVLCKRRDEKCSLTIPLTTNLTGNTTGEIISCGSHFTLSKCSLLFTTETCTRDKIACGRNTIQIQVGKNFEGSDLKLRIQLGPIVSTDAVWKDHDLPVIEGTLKSISRHFCFSVSASSIRTFGGSFYKHLGEGSFLLYRSHLSSTEVQIKKWYYNGVSTCPCAVAVREGNDVIVADMCYGQYKQSSLRFIIRSKLPLHENTKILESNNGRSFTIQLPSGTQVNIHEFYWGLSFYLSVTDLGEGLCRGATPASKETMKSLFNHSVYASTPLKSNTQDFCSCSGLRSLNKTTESCPPVSFSQVHAGLNDITGRISNKQKVLLKGFGFSKTSHFKHDHGLQADAPSQSMSYKRRKEICHKILNASDALQLCKDLLGKEIWQKIWQICVEETQEGLDMDLLKSSGETLIAICKQKIENMKNNAALLRRWKNELCESRCGLNGHCYQGNCKCNKGYGYIDCSIHLNTPPTLFPLEDPLCDVRNEICDEIFISGSPFLNFGSLSCSFTPLKRTSSSRSIEENHKTFTAKAVYYSARGVICQLPENQRSMFAKSQESFHIRVSNNGYLWSNPVLRIGYDSLCTTCTSIDSCDTKPGTCSIDSRCYVNGDVSVKNPCFKCSFKDDPHKWTPRSDNLPPRFNSPTMENITAILGDEISFVVNASDPEGKPLKVTHDVSQARLAPSDMFRWRPEEETTRTVEFLATDNCGLTTSKYVDIIVRKCPCNNSGKCVRVFKDEFKCVCPEKFKGVHCEVKISPCESSPCLRGRCKEDGDNFRCICDIGYSGNLCGHKLPACYSSPCKRGKCEEIENGFQCKCPRFYAGRLCETELSPCARAPCVRGYCRGNSGELFNQSNSSDSFECVCPQGFHGKVCSRRTTTCEPSPCHRGRCIDLGSNKMRCVCPPKHSGKFCNITKLYCGNTRCVNGACSSTSRDAVCVCHAGYTGPTCTMRTTSCDSNSCSHGVCINLNWGHLCHCYPGFSGPSCNISACSAVNCHNGTCILVSGRPVCRCAEDYVGDLCDRRRQPCDANPCVNGLCIATDANSFSCSCNPGFQGLLCGERIDPCLPKPCGDGVCEPRSNGTFSCKCPSGYLDPFCKEKRKISPCRMNPCVHGKCEVISDTDFQCKCERLYVGRLCEKRFDICASQPCAHGRCSSVLEGTFTCACDAGFSGALCQIDRRPCSKNPCFPGVRCSNVDEESFKCEECPSGYSGDGISCHPVKNEMKSLPCPRRFCFPGVQCSIINSQIHCGACPRGFFGNGFYCRELCEMPCHNGGVCVAPGVCRCRKGFIGVTCTRAFCRKSCLNGGRCIAPGKCRCPLSHFGQRCENARCNVRCLNGGKCILPGKCRCLPGYGGPTCEQAVCPLNCLNGGSCVKPGVCRCLPGYFGTRCQEGTCTPQCRNGGVCVRNNVCLCPQGYRGARCQTAVCQRPCQNGGRCFKTNQCSCPYGYWGDVCQYVHCLRPCVNKGVCIRPNVCLCPKDYAGVTCQFYVG